MEESDLVLYALFSRSFRPIGFLDFQGNEARKILKSLQVAVDKTVVVSFGSPYFGNQYFERAHTYVNAYSMLSPSVKAFVKAAMGEIGFDCGSCRLPLTPMTEENFRRLREVLPLR
jgi:hypothetical protein